MMTHRPRNTETPLTAFIFGILFLVIAMMLLVGALYYANQAETFVSRSQRTSGVVMSMTQKGNAYFPQVSFKDESGQDMVFNDPLGSNPPGHKVGDRINIIYPIGHPELAKEDSLLGLWLSPIVLGGASIFFLLSSFGTILNAILRWRKKAQN